MSTGAQAAQAPTQTTTTQLSPEQRQLLGMSVQAAQAYGARAPERFQGQVAGFDPAQTAGQEAVLGAAPAQSAVGQSAADAARFYTTGNIWDPAVNPNLRGAIDASVRPITEAYREQILPDIRNTAINTGGFGGSRQGIAETGATGKYLTAVGDTASKLAQSQYDTNVKAQLAGIQMSPIAQQALVQPGLSTSAVGDVRQAQSQAELNDMIAQFNFPAMAERDRAQFFASLAGGIPGGSVQTTGSVPNQQPGLSQALGGAAAGASIGSMFGPWGTAGGALLGGATPFLFR